MDICQRLERELFLTQVDFNDTSVEKIEASANINDLLSAFRGVVDRMGNKKNFNITAESLTVREKMTQILERVRKQPFLRFEHLFDPEEGKLGLVVSFMAILELVRDDMLVVVQNEPFSSIHIKSIDNH